MANIYTKVKRPLPTVQQRKGYGTDYHVRKELTNEQRSRPTLRVSKQKSFTNKPTQYPASSFSNVGASNLSIVNKLKAKQAKEKAEKRKLNQYYLKDSKPVLKENLFDVFDYFSEQHKCKATKVMPHLQPNNLKPYGASDTFLPPVISNKMREIVYPEISDTNMQRKVDSSDKLQMSSVPSQSLHREYCTVPVSHEQVTNCTALVPESSAKQTSLISVNKDEHPVTGTEPMGSLSTTSSTKKSNILTPVMSNDLEKCIQVISEFKKLNPDYTSNKKDLKSGSVEEKEAVINAVNFAARIKKYYNNKVDNLENLLSPKNKTVPDIQTREHHEGNAELNELSNTSERTEIESGPPPLSSLMKENSNQPPVERKKYSFDSAPLKLPEVAHIPVRVRVGPKANLLQSSAPPEAAKCWDEVRLDKNVRWVSPWPSYADQMKQILSQKDAKKIKYPSQDDSLKTVKNSTNLQIQQTKSKQLELNNCRTLHNDIQLVRKDDLVVARRTESHTNESLQKRLLHLFKNKVSSVPDMRRGLSSMSRQGEQDNCSEETVTQKRGNLQKGKNPICDSTKFDTPPQTTENFDSIDCYCIKPKVPTYCPPLKRLAKITIKEPPRVCPVADECDASIRADHGLVLRYRALPDIIPAKDCRPVPFKLKEGTPIPRLKKKYIEEPPRICPIEEPCPPRADAGLRIKKKCLPKLTAKSCPCVMTRLQDCPPLKPLKKVKIPEPVRVCPPEQKFECPPRADENAVFRKKALPKLKPSECPCIEGKPLQDVPLPRLVKRKVCILREPCKEPEPECPPRADEGLEIQPKKLRPLKPSHDCIPPEVPLKPGNPLKRLNIKTEDPPRICIEPCEFVCPPRADDGLEVKCKDLPRLKHPTCPCITEPELKSGVPLKPLNIKCKDPENRFPECVPDEPCPPRADEGMVITPKELPTLKASACPCAPAPVPKDINPLKRLKKVCISEPVRSAPECLSLELCPPRADDDMVIKQKELPQLKPSDCPCIESEPLQDVPLKRLKKVKVPEPPKICIEYDYCKDPTRDRADTICGHTIKRKKLPPMVLKAENNHVSTRYYGKRKKESHKPPTVNVSYKRQFSLYSRMVEVCRGSTKFNSVMVNRYSKQGECNSKATASKKWKRISTPKDPYKQKYAYKNCCCCCVNQEPPKYAPPLKRLPKFKEEDIEWRKLERCQTPCERARRADDTLKKKSKTLPKLKSSKCPCIEPEVPEYEPSLKRLPKFNKPDVDWAAKLECSTPCSRAVRADDHRKMRKKTLPKLGTSKCPCTELPEVVDAPRLKRLPKFKKEDRDWKKLDMCLTPCDKAKRADDTLKAKSKSLPKLKLSKCPCIEPDLPEYEPGLKRLPKFKKSDINWAAKLECSTPCSRAVRADDNSKMKQKILPKLECSKCPCTELPEVVKAPPLKRLPKFKKEDIDWEMLERCQTPCDRARRADDTLKTRSKSLPRLRHGKCPCVEPEIPEYEPSLKRLPKFNKPDVDWAARLECSTPCSRAVRADDNWRMKQKSLPKIQPKKCPCVELPEMVDAPPLKRLPKFTKKDVDWKKLERCQTPCDRAQRADDTLKKKSKRLKKLKPSKCPCFELELPVYAPPLKRLPKFKKPDVNWAKKMECISPCSKAVRADDNLIIKRKTLPKLECIPCPCCIKRGDVNMLDDKTEEKTSFMSNNKNQNERADDLLGYKVVKKKHTQPVIPRHCYHTTRRSHISYSTCHSVSAKQQKRIDEWCLTKERLAKSENKTEVAKKMCPQVSDGEYKFAEPTKKVTPYPSFSECGTLHSKNSDMPKDYIINYKTLQPHNHRNIIEPPLSDHLNIDVPTEKTYAMQEHNSCEVGIENLERKPDKIVQNTSNQTKEKVPGLSSTPEGKGVVSNVEDKSLWQKLCDFFKVKPSCPKSGELKKKKLIEDAERAAKAAGLILCRPEDSRARVDSCHYSTISSGTYDGFYNTKQPLDVFDACRSALSKCKGATKSDNCAITEDPYKNPLPEVKEAELCDSTTLNSCNLFSKADTCNEAPCKEPVKATKSGKCIPQWDKSSDCKTNQSDMTDPCRKPAPTDCGTSNKIDKCKNPFPRSRKSKRLALSSLGQCEKCKAMNCLIARRQQPGMYKKIRPPREKKWCPAEKQKPAKIKRVPPKASEKKYADETNNPCENEKVEHKVDYSKILPPEIPIPCDPKHRRIQIRPIKECIRKYTPMDECFGMTKERKEIHYDCTKKVNITENNTCQVEQQQLCRPPCPKVNTLQGPVDENWIMTALAKLRPDSQSLCGRMKSKKSNIRSRSQRALEFHSPLNHIHQHHTSAFGQKYKSEAKFPKLSAQTLEQRSVLKKRILIGLEKGLRKLESQNLNVSTNPYYQILTTLRNLSEKQLFDFFNKQPEFKAFNRLKDSTRETVSYACEINPKGDNPNSLESNTCAHPKCADISDCNRKRQPQESEIVKTFRKRYAKYFN